MLKSLASRGMKVGLYPVLLLMLILWLAAVLMLPGNPLDHLPGRDDGVFLYGGSQVLQGAAPYVDFWDHKGPVIYYLNALGLLLGRGSRWGVWGFEFLFLALTILGVYKVSKEQHGLIPAFISVIFFAYAVYQVGSYHFHESNYTETYGNLFNVLAVLVWLSARRYAHHHWLFTLIGVLQCLSFLLRPNSIGMGISIVLVELIYGARTKTLGNALKNVLAVLGGGLAGLLFFTVVLMQQGALIEAFDAIFVYNLVYSQAGDMQLVAYLSRVNGLMQLWLISLTCYFCLLVGTIRSWLVGKSAPFDDIFSLFLLVGCPLELCMISISGRLYPHYLIAVFPYFGWLVAGAAVSVIPFLKRRPAQSFIGAVPMILLAVLLVANLPAVMKYGQLIDHLTFHRAEGIDPENVLVNHVKSHTEPGDTVLVWGNDVWINFLAGRDAPTKYMFQYPLFVPGYMDGNKLQQFVEDLQANPPGLIMSINEVDRAEIVPLPTLLESQDASRQFGLPVQMNRLVEYINESYCVSAVLKDGVVYHFIGNGRADSQCQ